LSLTTYHHKRNFKQTPEPSGKNSIKAKAIYVIQKHAASHLHYDLRLEMNGVLKSWAIPKGPSRDASVKRLAVETEDHPIAYAKFHGTIPKGQYGAGKVAIWDKGTWKCEGPAYKNYLRGNMTFVLFGKKLKGRWKLIRIKIASAKNPTWLLIKIKDQNASHSH
jgi:bifunctional non-homologous end joining protein LigD